MRDTSRVAEQSFCVAGWAEEVEAGTLLELICSETSVGSIPDGFGGEFLAWPGNKPGDGIFCFVEQWHVSGEPLLAVQSRCRNSTATVKGQGRVCLQKKASLMEVQENSERFDLMQNEK